MIQSVNFPLSSYCIKPFGSWAVLEERVFAEMCARRKESGL